MSAPSRLQDFSLHTLDGKPLDLNAFAGKPVVIVNTASACGFTPQYAGLQALWQANRDAGLIVLGVPSNDFGGQEPGSATEIRLFCDRNFGVDFPLTEKLVVKGPQAHPLFRWLSGQAGFWGRPRWNFYKYLIGRDGRLEDWFSSKTAPGGAKFQSAVQRLLRS
ncbi:MAG TPA: glutathione peroxidase [Stellaceae bacterium]|nr:glutathione peroxidase [Stellaceae bacterium]